MIINNKISTVLMDGFGIIQRKKYIKRSEKHLKPFSSLDSIMSVCMSSGSKKGLQR